MAIWQEQFATQCKIKKAVILHGNVQDAFWDRGLNGISIKDYIVQELTKIGYSDILCWDRIDGARGESDGAAEAFEQDATDTVATSVPANTPPKKTFDLGDDDDDHNTRPSSCSGARGTQVGKDAEGFFRILLKRFRNRQKAKKATAYIIDGADALFGNANSLSEQERIQLLMLGNALRDSECTLESSKLDQLSDLLIIIVPRIALLPSRFYQDNPSIAQVFIGRPDRKDRETFLKKCLPSLVVKEAIASGNCDFNELVDSLEDFTYRDMQQLIHLSRTYQKDPLSFKKLVKLYKFGESKSPWEDLNQERIAKAKEYLKDRVKGQDHVVDRVYEVIVKAFLGLSGLQHSARQQKPKGTLFFVGPTGVGKTEMAKAIACFLFGEEEACIRFDMSEYSAEHSDQRLLGAPPGYVGYEEGGQLTNAVRRRPFSVILFDEIEKAHSKICDKFLQILEDGRLTDSKGDTVSFSESIIIFTSNIGASKVDINDPDVHAAFIKEVEEHFVQEMKRPELLNRIGQSNIIPFNFLTDREVLIKIANAKLRPLIQKLKDKFSVTLTINPEDLSILLTGFNAANGGRGIANRISDLIIDPLTMTLFDCPPEDLYGAEIIAKVSNGKFRFRIKHQD